MPTTGYSFLVSDKRHVIVDSNGSNVTAIISGDAAADLDSINATLTTWQPDIASNTANIDSKITRGSEDTLTYAQQVGSYVKNESTNIWQPLIAHHSNKSLKVSDANITNGNQISKIMGIDSAGTQQQIKVSTAGRIELDAYNLSSLSTANNQTNGTQVSKIMGSEDGATTGIQHQLKVGDTGRLIVEVDGIRSSGSQTWTIGAGATVTSTEIDMGTHTRIAFYGNTNNTVNLWIRLEYSQDGTNWFQGSEENAKVVIVSATGTFYDEEIVTPPSVRLWRKNTTGATETINLYWTQL